MSPLSAGQWLACRRASRRLHRFLDRDPAAPLTNAELAAVEQHLRDCARCAGLANQYRALHRSLQRVGESLTPDAAAVQRVRISLQRALESEGAAEQ
jgi:predicted anti-sigma-YlaC factor YlaD